MMLDLQHILLRAQLAQQAQRITELEDQWRKTNTQYESAAKAVTRQAQEVERLKHEKADLVQRNQILRTRPDLPMTNEDKATFKRLEQSLSATITERDYYKADYERCEEVIASLEQDLSAMTTERDEANAHIHQQQVAYLDASNTIEFVKTQLAASQARCQELEEQRQYHMTQINRLAAVTNTLGEKSETVIGHTIATLAAQERELEQHKAFVAWAATADAGVWAFQIREKAQQVLKVANDTHAR